MAVVLSIVPTAASNTNVADALAPALSNQYGADLGQVANGSYTPLVGNQAANAGCKELYLKHNAQHDPITDVVFYIGPFTGIYGGPQSPNSDYNQIIAQGAQDAGGTANNADGLSSGLQMDMSFNVSVASQFAPAREFTGQKRIFGKTYSLVQVGTQTYPILMHRDAAFYFDGLSNSPPLSPADGVIGKSDDTIRGNTALVRLRYYLPSSAAVGGLLQWSFITLFSYTPSTKHRGYGCVSEQRRTCQSLH